MTISIFRRTLLQVVSAGLACAALPVVAQTAWPSKPIKIIVPYTAGGFTDQMARILVVDLQKQLGQPVVIDNKPGANSIIGVDAVAKAAPDGYTFGVVIPAFTANTTLYPKLPYNPRKDLVGVSLLGVSPLVAAVSSNAPFKNVPELVAYAKAHPGKVSFASSGSGSRCTCTLGVNIGRSGPISTTWLASRHPSRKFTSKSFDLSFCITASCYPRRRQWEPAFQRRIHVRRETGHEMTAVPPCQCRDSVVH